MSRRCSWSRRNATEANSLAAALYMLPAERAIAVADSLRCAVMVIRYPRSGGLPGPNEILMSVVASRVIQLTPAFREGGIPR